MESARGFADLMMDAGFRDCEDGNPLDDATALVESRDAAVRADERQKAAERAVKWCDDWNGYDIMQPESGDTLRVAIMADPKEGQNEANMVK